MQVIYFMNGTEGTKDNHEVCTQGYDCFENVYILDGKKAYGISFVYLDSVKVIKITEMYPTCPLDEVGSNKIPDYDWVPVNAFCSYGEERGFLLNFISMFSEAKQESIQVAFTYLIKRKSAPMVNYAPAEQFAELQLA